MDDLDHSVANEITIGPIMKREPVSGPNEFLAILGKQDRGGASAARSLLGEDVEGETMGCSEVYHDEVHIPNEDPLGDISSSNKVCPPSPYTSTANYYNEDEYQDEIDEIEGIINECQESTPYIQEVVTVKYEVTTVNEVDCDETNEVLDDRPLTTQEVHKGPQGKKHGKLLKPIKTAICLQCNTGFPSADLYEHHMSTVHKDERPYACKFCGKRFKINNNRQRHETIHDPKRFTGSAKFACDLCDKRYHLKTSLESHRKKFHFGYKQKPKRSSAPITEHHSNLGTKNPNPYRKPKETFPCPHCDLTFNMRCNLQKHMFCHTKKRDFSCQICGQPFYLKSQLKYHIRTVHETATPSGAAHPTPKWLAGRLYTCSVCSKVFKVQSRYRYHMRNHTGEKPHECSVCGEKFARTGSLKSHFTRKHATNVTNNPLKLFKCLICGRGNFIMFTDLRQHRIKQHGHIPYDSEREKPFTCTICGKPHFLRENAIICTLLGHDPTSLRYKMFRNQCPECPPDAFGYRHMTLLRSHWEEVHPVIPMPSLVRIGMYSEKEPDMTLPSCTIDKKKAKDIKLHGPPAELMNGEEPLFIERELLPIPKENWFRRRCRGPRKQCNRESISKNIECDICGLSILRRNLNKHKITIHDPNRVETCKSRKVNVKSLRACYNCSVCNLRFRKMKTLRAHEKIHQTSNFLPGRRGPGRPRKYNVGISAETILTKSESTEDFITNITIKEEPKDEQEENSESQGVSISSMFRCRFCSSKFITVRSLRVHEKIHLRPSSTVKEDFRSATIRVPPTLVESTGNSYASSHVDRRPSWRTVNVNDKEAIRTMLSFQTVHVRLTRLNDGKKTTGSKNENMNNTENRPSASFPGVLDEEEGTTSKSQNASIDDRWKVLLGNKSVRVVLCRVDDDD